MTGVDEASAGRGRRGARTLAACCSAHVLHDGFTDVLYLFLPLWQAEFGLSLAATGLMRGVYSGIMAAFQMPASLLAERLGAARLLVLGTAVSGLAYLAAGAGGGMLALVLCLALGGIGSSVQHPLSSLLVTQDFAGKRLRAALGTYNFAGDLGKVAMPALAALLVAAIGWRGAAAGVGLCGLAGATLLALLLPRSVHRVAAADSSTKDATPDAAIAPGRRRAAFASLAAIGVIDSATRTGFLTFLPVLLAGKGASVATVGLALGLVFAGGALGKFACGLAAERLGIIRSVVLTEAATAGAILLLLPLPLTAALALLPLLGIGLNGTSSVLYATVGEVADPARRARAFGFFYTVTIGSGAAAPFLYGLVSDHVGVAPMMELAAVLVLAVIPLTLPLARALRDAAGHGRSAAGGAASGPAGSRA